jgi:transcriptional regulator with XRE-family HTH domain
VIFNGEIIRIKAKEAGLNLLQLAGRLGVSRQTVNSWIGGQSPRGGHLVKLCSLLNVRPDNFFNEQAENPVSVPLHRTIRGKGVTPDMRKVSQELAEQYLNLFRQTPPGTVLPVVRFQKRTAETVTLIADQLRRLSGVQADKPMDYNCAFQLLAKAGIYTVFRSFPDELRRNSYAFYSKIAGNRVVFVNIDTNVLDLIFQLLHETVHAVRDEESGNKDSDEEEALCDDVAESTQFPDYYVNMVALAIRGLDSAGVLINRLKAFSQENAHSLWGISYRLQHKGILQDAVNVAGAATNLNKNFPTIRQILYKKDDSRHFIDSLFKFSPNFMNLIAAQVPHCSTRKLGEWLGLESSLDASAVMEEIARIKAQA